MILLLLMLGPLLCVAWCLGRYAATPRGPTTAAPRPATIARDAGGSALRTWLARPTPIAPYPTPIDAAFVGSPQTRAAARRILGRAAASPSAATALTLAALLSPEPVARSRQLHILDARLDPTTRAAVAGAILILAETPVEDRLPALLPLLDTLDAYAPLQQLQLRQTFADLDALNLAPSVLQVCLRRLALGRLARPLPPEIPDLGIEALLGELTTLCAILARIGRPDPMQQYRAYAAGLRLLTGTVGDTPNYNPPTDWRHALTHALEALEQLQPAARRRVHGALVRIASHNGHLSCEAAEILRTVTCELDQPLLAANASPMDTGRIRIQTAA